MNTAAEETKLPAPTDFEYYHLDIYFRNDTEVPTIPALQAQITGQINDLTAYQEEIDRLCPRIDLGGGSWNQTIPGDISDEVRKRFPIRKIRIGSKETIGVAGKRETGGPFHDLGGDVIEAAFISFRYTPNGTWGNESGMFPYARVDLEFLLQALPGIPLMRVERSYRAYGKDSWYCKDALDGENIEVGRRVVARWLNIFKEACVK